eukprot:SAG11_NODE_854_length_6864_cov_6.972087_6_plen_131_part_00
MGLAASGCRAVADTMTVDFMLEAFSTLVQQAGKLRYMSGGATAVPMVMRSPSGNTKNMGPHHAGCYWPLFAHCPGLLVAVPAFAADAKGLMKTALRYCEDPVNDANLCAYARLWHIARCLRWRISVIECA